MATTYPGTIDSFTNPSGTQTLDSPDHALQHTNANGAVIALETVLGTTAGTAVLKDFSAGHFPARVNSGGTLVQTLIGGTLSSNVINSPTVGTPTVNLGSDAQGDILYRSAGGTVTRLGIGAASTYLTSNGTIPSWGTITTTKPAFMVHRNNSDQSSAFGASASFVKVQWTTEEFDTNNNFDPATNYRFTPTVSGKYNLSAQATFNNTIADATNVYVAIYKNGSSYKLMTAKSSGTTGFSLSVNCVTDANGSSDYFEVFTSTDNGSALNLDGAPSKSYFCGCKID